MLFDVGPFGAGHQHEDKLGFVIYAYGAYLVIDSGIYPYDTSRWRRYVLSPYAHNVIHVDKKTRRVVSRRDQAANIAIIPAVDDGLSVFDGEMT